MFGKKILKNRIKQLEQRNAELEIKLKDEKNLSGTYRVVINDQNRKIEELEIKVKNQKECIKKLEAEFEENASNSDEKTCITSSL